MARKVTYDETKVKELRMKVILASLDVMNDNEKVVSKWSQYKKDLIMKYAPRVLPVLNEVSGKDGTPLMLTFDKTFNVTPPQTETDSS